MDQAGRGGDHRTGARRSIPADPAQRDDQDDRYDVYYQHDDAYFQYHYGSGIMPLFFHPSPALTVIERRGSQV